jgi:flagellar hook-associated protein FlgK
MKKLKKTEDPINSSMSSVVKRINESLKQIRREVNDQMMKWLMSGLIIAKAGAD